MSEQIAVPNRQESISGLTTVDVEDRIKRFGYNRLPQGKKISLYVIFIKQFASPLIYILLVSAFISLLVGEYYDSIFIMVVLLINAVMGTIQEYSAQKSADSLKHMIKSKTFVIRNHKKLEIDSEELVPDDIVILNDGSLVPADMVLLEAMDLYVNESLLTGESDLVKKDSRYIQTEDCGIHERFNEVFAGSMVIKGHGIARVKYTGSDTEIGKLNAKISEASEVRTPLTSRIEKFTIGLTIVIGIIIGIISIIFLYRGESFMSTLLIAVGLAVAAIPEGLPVTITITLTVGVIKMAKRNVIVKNLCAVESLGSCTVIASDKTGTLTMNEMSIQNLSFANGVEYKVDTSDTIPAHKKTIFVDNLEQASLEVKSVLASVLPNEAGMDGDKYFGDPVDVAFLKYANSCGYSLDSIKTSFKILKYLFFSSEKRCTAAFTRIGGKIYVFVKGAPEDVLQMCNDDHDKEDIIKKLKNFTENGFRVLALAYGEVDELENVRDYDYKHLTNLNFLSLVSMLDPLKPGVAQSIKLCQSAGIKVVMITGDNAKTAFSIAKQLGFVKSFDEVKTGLDVKRAKAQGDQILDHLTKDTVVYARMDPTQKLDIVESLIRNGHFVAVTGDGVNDAPALKNANVGVAMGKYGTDIARQSADIILMDDNFHSITNAVEDGRISYNNIRKLIFFAVSCGIAEVAIFLGAILLGLPAPFTPAQLLWLNVVTEGVQDVFLAFEIGEGNEMNQSPRPPQDSIFNRLMIRRCALFIAYISTICVGAFYFCIKVLKYSYVKSSSILLMLCVLVENVQILNSRSETKSVFKHSLKTNKKLVVGILGAIVLHVAAAYIPVISKLLRLEPIGFLHFVCVLFLAITLLLVSEFEKYLRAKNII